MITCWHFWRESVSHSHLPWLQFLGVSHSHISSTQLLAICKITKCSHQFMASSRFCSRQTNIRCPISGCDCHWFWPVCLVEQTGRGRGWQLRSSLHVRAEHVFSWLSFPTIGHIGTRSHSAVWTVFVFGFGWGERNKDSSIIYTYAWYLQEVFCQDVFLGMSDSCGD